MIQLRVELEVMIDGRRGSRLGFFDSRTRYQYDNSPSYNVNVVIGDIASEIETKEIVFEGNMSSWIGGDYDYMVNFNIHENDIKKIKNSIMRFILQLGKDGWMVKDVLPIISSLSTNTVNFWEEGYGSNTPDEVRTIIVLEEFIQKK